MRNRFVKMTRIRFGDAEHYRYLPVELRNGVLYPLAKPEECDDAPYGFFAPSSAWAVINAIEGREAHR